MLNGATLSVLMTRKKQKCEQMWTWAMVRFLCLANQNAFCLAIILHIYKASHTWEPGGQNHHPFCYFHAIQVV